MSNGRRNDADITRMQKRGANSKLSKEKGVTPEWDGLKPGQHPLLPKLPPGRAK